MKRIAHNADTTESYIVSVISFKSKLKEILEFLSSHEG